MEHNSNLLWKLYFNQNNNGYTMIIELKIKPFFTVGIQNTFLTLNYPLFCKDINLLEK